MSFQDELKKNLRSPKDAQAEKRQREIELMMPNAKVLMKEIKASLLQKAADGEYTQQDDVLTVSCLCPFPRQYLSIRTSNNSKALARDQKLPALFRDPTLRFEEWAFMDVSQRYKSEYESYMIALYQLAAKENIKLECVVYDTGKKKVYPFPTVIQITLLYVYELRIQASTEICGVSLPDGITAPVKAPKQEQERITVEHNEDSVGENHESQQHNHSSGCLRSFAALLSSLSAIVIMLSSMESGSFMGVIIGLFLSLFAVYLFVHK